MLLNYMEQISHVSESSGAIKRLIVLFLSILKRSPAYCIIDCKPVSTLLLLFSFPFSIALCYFLIFLFLSLLLYAISYSLTKLLVERAEERLTESKKEYTQLHSRHTEVRPTFPRDLSPCFR